LAHGERMREYALEAYSQGQWKELVRGSAIGHKKIDRFDTVETDQLRVRILSSVEKPLIRNLAAYHVE
ncbi:alpha-L-fucosidase, partial [Clostridium perfringens]